MEYLGQGQVSTNEGRWTLQLGGVVHDLTTIDVTDGPQGETLGEVVRRRGKAIGYQRTAESAAAGGGGTFTFTIEKWEFDAVFGFIEALGRNIFSFPFNLTHFLPVKKLNEETGEEEIDYGAERMVIYQDCRALGDPQPSNAADGVLVMTLSCGFLRKSETVKNY